jgi:hypothetical protein
LGSERVGPTVRPDERADIRLYVPDPHPKELGVEAVSV